jgi:hypothetical protein
LYKLNIIFLSRQAASDRTTVNQVWRDRCGHHVKRERAGIRKPALEKDITGKAQVAGKAA